MTLYRIRIVDGIDLFLGVINKDRLGSAVNALLDAGRIRGAGVVFGSAAGVADIPGDLLLIFAAITGMAESAKTTRNNFILAPRDRIVQRTAI